MTNEMTFSKAGLPTPQALVSALRSLELDIGLGGVAIIKMDKTGAWVLGAEQTEIEPDSLWAVNPFSFMHGYIAWGDGEVLGEDGISQPTSPRGRSCTRRREKRLGGPAGYDDEVHEW